MAFSQAMQTFNPSSFISQVVAYLDKQDPTPELNCLRLVVLSGVHPKLVVSLHTSQVELEDPAITESVRKFFGSIAPEGAGYYFPRGSSHTPLSDVQEAWEAMCLLENIHGPAGSQPEIGVLADVAAQVLAK